MDDKLMDDNLIEAIIGRFVWQIGLATAKHHGEALDEDETELIAEKVLTALDKHYGNK